ncbi:PEP-CTERM sorting domain-containing protein [Sphingobium sp. CAP-1]|uniref:PEP-CTERM sorting domain-containing protein n=1 Tax=Sphingobium sp. CAP-1 TaxID=2676077 RepID=UPI0012BB2D70|nr:PEP-CTERM sorting domain-containing protein [Sphingobium sp. CAP-1]QGP78185.1 PEP-CTERM sorting domain-containing protein [Sphingobium sp. CAP-1]
MDARTEKRHVTGMLFLVLIGGAGVLSLGGLMRAMFLPSDVAAAVRQDMLVSGNNLVGAPVLLGTGQMLSGGPTHRLVNGYRPLGAPDTGGAQSGILPPPVGAVQDGGVGGDGNGQQFALASPAAFGPAGTGSGGATGSAAGGGVGGSGPIMTDIGVEPTPSGSDTSFNPGDGGVAPTEPLPEPETWAMMTVGLAAAGWFARRKRRQAQA